MDIKERLASFIKQLLTNYGITQSDLARLLGISTGSLQPYLKGKSLPNLDIVMKLAELGGVTIDELLKTEKSPEKKEISITIGGNATVGAGVVNGDVYQNTTVRKVYQYTYQPGDLTEGQAAQLQKLVNDIVELEQKVKRKPTTHAAVWGALKRRYKVAYYRKIREEDFPMAEAYLRNWIGRLNRPLVRKDPDEARKKRQAAIFAAAKNQLGLTKKELDNYIFNEFGVNSIKDLSMDKLEVLYNRVMAAKRK